MQGEFPEDNLQHSYSVDEFFDNLSGTGGFWVGNDNVSINLADGSSIDITSFTMNVQPMTENSDLINVLGTAIGQPIGNSSDLYSLYWPRGGTNNPNTAVIDIRADQSTVDAIADDFFQPCD